MEPSARYENVTIPLPEGSGTDVEAVSGILGVPEWWPTGSRIGVVIAHGRSETLEDPVVADLHRGLTERGYLSLRFNFPFAESGKRRPDKDAVLERAFAEAVHLLGRDPTAAPAHLFLGGKGLGARTAARLAMTRMRLEGLFFLAHPLHKADKVDEVDADHLYRIIAPMLFLQGSRDRYCDLDVLRRTLLRVGAPTQLQVIEEADHAFKVLKKSGRTHEELLAQVLSALDGWMHKVLGG